MTDRLIRLWVKATESRYLAADAEGEYYVILKGTTGVVTDSRIYLKPKPNTRKKRDDDDGPIVLLSVHWDVAIVGRDMKDPDKSTWHTSCFEEPNVEPEGVEIIDLEDGGEATGPDTPPRTLRLLNWSEAKKTP